MDSKTFEPACSFRTNIVKGLGSSSQSMNMQAAALAYRRARSCSSAVSEHFSHRGTITSCMPWGPRFSYRAAYARVVHYLFSAQHLPLTA
jgi:hypothetical protein